MELSVMLDMQTKGGPRARRTRPQNDSLLPEKIFFGKIIL
jgi:hypothetical protein